MKYLSLILALLISACSTSQKIPIDSNLYSTGYNDKGELISKTKMSSMVLSKSNGSKGLVLKSATAKTNKSGTAAYYSGLYVWPEHMAEFKNILTDSITNPINENTHIRTKLGVAPAIIKKQEIKSEVYLIVITEDGVLGFNRNDIQALVDLVGRIQSSESKM